MPENLLVKGLLEVATEIRTITRKKENSQQGYKFVAAFDAQQEIMPKLLERGILFYPERRRVVDIQPYTTKSGVQSFLVIHESIWVATDGTNRIEVSVIGSGADMGDKGAYKGMTGDMKYALSQMLGIAFTDDDPEADDISESEGPSAKELKALAVKAKKAGVENLAESVEKLTGKKTSEDLRADDLRFLHETYDTIIAAKKG